MLVDAGRQPQSSGRLRRVILGALIIVLALVAAVAAWAYYHRDEFTVGLFRPGPATLLGEVVTRSGLPVANAGPIETVDLDGTMPASATRTLTVSRSAEAIRATIVRACRELGFGAPDALERSAEPDLVCRGDWNEWSASVHLSTACAGRCDATITTRAI